MRSSTPGYDAAETDPPTAPTAAHRLGDSPRLLQTPLLAAGGICQRGSGLASDRRTSVTASRSTASGKCDLTSASPHPHSLKQGKGRQGGGSGGRRLPWIFGCRRGSRPTVSPGVASTSAALRDDGQGRRGPSCRGRDLFGTLRCQLRYSAGRKASVAYDFGLSSGGDVMTKKIYKKPILVKGPALADVTSACMTVVSGKPCP